MQGVTGFQDLDHGSRGEIGPELLLNRLVPMGVEWLAQGVDRGYTVAAEDIE